MLRLPPSHSLHLSLRSASHQRLSLSLAHAFLLRRLLLLFFRPFPLLRPAAVVSALRSQAAGEGWGLWGVGPRTEEEEQGKNKKKYPAVIIL